MVNKVYKKDRNSARYKEVVYSGHLSTKNVSIGFEWEAKLLNKFYYKQSESYKQILELGYKQPHYDSGGMEIDSPIFRSIATARSHARYVRACVLRDTDYFNTSQPTATGIHVHVTDCSDRDTLLNYLLIWNNMWRDREWAKFCRSISGRPANVAYTGQSKPWFDLKFENVRRGYKQWNYHNNSLRLNMPDFTRTMEFRMFSGHHDRLLVAIDFAHFTFKFFRSWRRSDPPGLKEWINKLVKTKGYKELKSDPTVIKAIKEYT